uniref:Uncharacterized protein n=1 Tax=Anopheles merus TaxID=30066 RepID=A0A182V4P8_ANOME
MMLLLVMVLMAQMSMRSELTIVALLRNRGRLWLRRFSSPKMVAISPCMNAHGIVELASGHFSPLGQYTSAPEPCWCGKQNLWCPTDGHCTKCVSSSRSWHRVHLSVGFGAGAGGGPPVPGGALLAPEPGGGGGSPPGPPLPGGPPAPPLPGGPPLPLPGGPALPGGAGLAFGPAGFGPGPALPPRPGGTPSGGPPGCDCDCDWGGGGAVRGGGGPGGLGPFRGLPGGRVSVIDIRFAIGLCNGATDGAGGVPSPPPPPLPTPPPPPPPPIDAGAIGITFG